MYSLPGANVRRFFTALPPDVACPGTITLQDAHLLRHLKTVLRYKPGTQVLLASTETGLSFAATLLAYGRQGIDFHLETRIEAGTAGIPLTLGVALIKSHRWDWLLEKVTELGVETVFPITAARSVVRLAGMEAGKKRERWLEITRNAAEQCEASWLPRIAAPASIADFIQVAQAMPDPVLRVVLEARGSKRQSLTTLLSTCETPIPVVVAVGPEGGWEPVELDQLTNAGFRPVRLGARILRSETAALALASAVLYAYDRFLQ